jgi:uncharacterized protein (DUF2225 family)
MSGWLDFYEAEIICPFCKSVIEVTIWEDGDPNREPIVVSGLIDDKVECPVCKINISEDILNKNQKSKGISR